MILDLDGPAWSIREALGDTWQWYIDKPLTGRNNTGDALGKAGRAPGWLPARVPGAVIGDLFRAGEIPDPYVGRNSRQAEWTASRTWVYRREFDVRPLAAGERAVLCLDGVDPGGRVYVDTVEVGRIDGLYRQARFDVTAQVAGGGRHVLAVVVEPAPASEPQVGRTERVSRHTPRMGYGWDFCPRLVHQGIWRGVRLKIGRVHLHGASVRPELDQDLRSARVHLRATLDTPPDAEPLIEVTVRDGQRVVAREPMTTVPAEPGRHRLEATVQVPEPALWWPNGLGDQPLYTVEIQAKCDDSADTGSWTVGFRHVRMVTNDGVGGALPYTAEVNGSRVALIGWNWAPADALYGDVDPAKVEHLVDLAARSGARVLRVWGGGLIETPAFYDACDRAGIFVWQEFSQSSSGMQSAPSSDPAFVEHLRAEARAVVPPRTHHPSLLLWGGGNELEDDAGPLDERSPALAALRDEVVRLDPGRPWLPTSPTGPRFHNRLDVIDDDPGGMHDVHGPWEHQGLAAQYTLYNRGQALAHTEFGVEGMANRRLWRELIPAEHRSPVGRENPVYRHLGEWWNNAELVQACFGGRLTSPDSFRRASQLLQATGLAYAVEADRRRWPRCSMVLPWQLAESYPNAWCTSVVDHSGEPKPAYHAVRRAYQPERVTARLDRIALAGEHAGVEAWVWSEPGRSGRSRVAARLLTADGEEIAAHSWAVPEPVGHPRPAGRLDVDLSALGIDRETILFWSLEWTDADGSLIDDECVLVSAGSDLSPLLDLTPALLHVAVETHPGAGQTRVSIKHLSGPAVVGLRLTDDRPPDVPGWAVVDNDPRPLLPGGRRTLTAEWRSAPANRRLLLESWNTDPVPVEDIAS